MNGEERRGRVVGAANALFTAGVMSHSGHGNLSARVDGQRFLLTTTGVIRDLRPGELATVTVDGAVEDGEDPLSTARLVVAIEEAAEAELTASALGGAVDFPPDALQTVRESMGRVRSRP